MKERRANPNPMDLSGALAILYTLGYFFMVGVMFFAAIPVTNREPILTLIGLMSAIQMAIIQFFFGSSKNAESTQRAVVQQQSRTAATAIEVLANRAPATTENMQVTAGNVDVTEKPTEAASALLCPNCKAPQEPGVSFCNKCGAPQPKDGAVQQKE